MQRYLISSLWIGYCIILCAAPEMDDIRGTLRVRNGIRKLPHPFRNITNDEKARWQLIKNEIGRSAVDQVAEWLRRWTANPLGFPRVITPRATSLFMRKAYGLSSGNFLPKVNSQLHSQTIFRNRDYYNQSARTAFAPQIHISSSATFAPFYGISDSKRSWKHIVSSSGVPSSVEPGPKELKANTVTASFQSYIPANSKEIALASTLNRLHSPLLVPYQQQRQKNTYRYEKNHFYGANIPTSVSPSQAQEYDPARPSLYYNPWDPFGLLNNPFWKSIFPGLFAPQPQLFISTTAQPAQSLNPQQRLAVIPKRSRLSPNQKLALCCKKQNLSPSCQLLCNYDTFTDRSLVTAVISNQCPGHQLETAFNCATSMADHSTCCIRNGIGTYRNGHCMVFCTTHLGNPSNTLQYIDCLQVFDRIKNCYREYHTVNPNIYGDL
uniref:Domain of unknown function DB domain-containing protein n=1 Tax=Setaria digitata TaxID=48799 RepID=A0A915PTI3_9BILA